MNIVLDMDNTLIASDSTNIYPRPFLVPFLKFCFENFRTVSIWTAAEESWFNIVNKFVFQPILTQLSQQLHKQCKFYFVLTRPSVKFVYTSHTSKLGQQNLGQQNLGQQNVGQQNVVMIKDLNDIWRKPLTYPGFTMGNTVIIDDIPETFSNNKCNGIWITPFYGNPNDTKLLEMINHLRGTLGPDKRASPRPPDRSAHLMI